MSNLIDQFKSKIKGEGRTFKWFHKTFLKNVTYPYFIIQLNENDRLHIDIKTAVEKYLNQ